MLSAEYTVYTMPAAAMLIASTPALKDKMLDLMRRGVAAFKRLVYKITALCYLCKEKEEEEDKE